MNSFLEIKKIVFVMGLLLSSSAYSQIEVGGNNGGSSGFNIDSRTIGNLQRQIEIDGSDLWRRQLNSNRSDQDNLRNIEWDWDQVNQEEAPMLNVDILLNYRHSVYIPRNEIIEITLADGSVVSIEELEENIREQVREMLRDQR